MNSQSLGSNSQSFSWKFKVWDRIHKALHENSKSLGSKITKSGIEYTKLRIKFTKLRIEFTKLRIKFTMLRIEFTKLRMNEFMLMNSQSSRPNKQNQRTQDHIYKIKRPLTVVEPNPQTCAADPAKNINHVYLKLFKNLVPKFCKKKRLS